jgi:cell division protein FtsX
MPMTMFLQFWAELREVAWHARDLLQAIAMLSAITAIAVAVFTMRWQATSRRKGRIMVLQHNAWQDKRAA